MFLRIFLPFFFWITTVETCVRTIPPEQYYPSSTLPPNECETCDINKIAPENLQTGTKFDFTDIPTTGDCISTSARCSRTDGQVCTSIVISSVTSTTSTALGTASNADEVTARLDCKDNGMYSSGMATEVSRISCAFTGCELACTTCDINTIAPTGLGTGEKFSFVEQGAAGACKQTQVTCARDGGLICESISINGLDSAVIATTSQTVTTSAVLTCQADKTYSSGAITGINQLQCVYKNCVAPCPSCDTAALTPTDLPTGASFEFTETNGACKSAMVTCKRDDMATCTASISAISPMGTTVLGTLPSTTSVSATLDCGGDGLYSVDVITGISKISCAFTDCILPCTTCNINDIAPTGLGTGEKFSFVEQAATGACKQTQVTCARDDGKICESVSITGPGSTEIATTQTSTTSAVLSCQADKTYSSGTITGINQLTCVFTNCVAPCLSCDTAALTPTSLPAGAIFEFTEASGACKSATVTCKRNDMATCTISISAISPMGTNVLGTVPSTTFVSSTLDCSGDGLYSVDGVTGISKISCGFTDCISCQTCDSSTIPVTAPTGSTFEFTQLAPGADGCVVTQLTCKRTDGQICTNIQIMATTPNGPSTVGSGDKTAQASSTLTCGANGKYLSGSASDISQLTCVYTGCKPACETCDAAPLAPMLPAGQVFDIYNVVAAGTCKKTYVSCYKSDGRYCATISVNGPGSTVLASETEGSGASAQLDCQNDGTFSQGTNTQITELSCTFTDCKFECEKCNIIPITPTGTTYEITELAPGADGCSNRRITCKRTDGQTCSNVQILATIAVGTVEIVSTQNADQMSTPLSCKSNGRYSAGMYSGITQLTCAYTNCKTPCETCNIATISPPPLAGTTFEFTQLGAAGECVQTQITCKRTDGQWCTISIGANNIDGPNTLITAMKTGTLSTTIDCQGDGKYAMGVVTGITSLTCSYSNCAPSCSLCDISTIPFTANNAFITKTIMELGADPNGCKATQLGCSVIAGACFTKTMMADTPSGPISVLTNSPTTTSATSILTCAADGTYSYGGVSGITAINCNFVCL